MSYAWITEPLEAKGVWGVSWGIDAPWAHPVWSQYAMHLYDLTSEGSNPPVIYLPEATHEVLLCAVNPDTPIVRDVPLNEQKFGHLEPANYGYQFRAVDNQTALDRLQVVVDTIAAQKLNPDTDYRAVWDALFSDAYPLVQNTFANLFSTKETH